MTVAIVTGSGGLVGAETTQLFLEHGLEVVGIDNDMRKTFFGAEASTAWQVALLRQRARYTHISADIRDTDALDDVFRRYGRDVGVIVHCAAQPSHDWAVRQPATDFTVNANGTLALLEATRQHASDAVFIFVSTNKVYGDRPNELPLLEGETRFEVAADHPWFAGIPEDMPVDRCLHSLFGVSKLAADLLVQEYGRYFGIKTACFRGGCLTGPGHSGTQLHGFLAYLVRCAVTGEPYTIFGYKGKQVRDNIHARDLVEAFWAYFRRPASPGEVFNIGGSRHSNCSMLEAISMAEELTGRPMNYSYTAENRIGDHIWYVSDVRKFQARYPEWQYRYDVRQLMADIYEGVAGRYAKKINAV